MWDQVRFGSYQMGWMIQSNIWVGYAGMALETMYGNPSPAKTIGLKCNPKDKDANIESLCFQPLNEITRLELDLSVP